jgi:uncharacterized protein YkuJ
MLTFRYFYLFVPVIRRIPLSFLNSVFELKLFSGPEADLFKNITLISIEVWRRNKFLMKK